MINERNRAMKADIIHHFPEYQIYLDVFSSVTNLDGLVKFLLNKSDLYAQQNLKEFHTNKQEIRLLLGINCKMSLVRETIEIL